MTGSEQADARTTGVQSPGVQPDGAQAGAAAPPATQEKTDGPMDAAEFAARLDVDPERDDVKG